MTLLERWDKPDYLMHITRNEIRRALAIAQAVDDLIAEFITDPTAQAKTVFEAVERADELLEGR